MNARERYVETLSFGSPDKIPFEPGGPRESTLKRWHGEGLPEHVHYMDALYDELGFRPEPPRQPLVDLGVSFRMNPTFEEKVLEHKDGHYIVLDWMGNVTEISDEFDYTYIRQAKDFVTRKWHKFPVSNHDEWEAMKTRFDVNDPVRFPEDFEQRCRTLADRDYVLGVQFSGPFWQLREWCGFEPLCMMMAVEPEFAEEMVDFWTDFCSTLLQRVLDHVQPDYVYWSEDMAYKAHSMISPAMIHKFLQPAWTRWSNQAQAAGVKLIDVDSDGYIGEIIPIWIDSGVNVCDPIEVAAHCDIVEFRRQFGTRMAYRGGIDKRAIAKGGKVIEAELERVIPPLVEQGGYIPSCDHGVPPDISWPDFRHYARLLAQYCGWI